MMDAVVLAGGLMTETDPLYPLIPEDAPKYKAFLTINGKPILQWVLDVLDSSPKIENIILVGQPEQNGFSSAKPIYFLEDTGNLVENIISGVTYSSQVNPMASHSMIASGDVPLIRPEMVDWVIANAEKLNVDITYNVITEDVMEARFPGSNRTFAPLKGARVCGGDLNVISHAVVKENTALWKQLTDARKSVFKQASIFGPRLLIGLLLRQLTLDQTARYLSKRLGLEAKAVVCPYAELAMDVDKPHQFEIVKRDIGGA
ncbi:MAG: NTP transferase domain-containing protein [Anaerolineales bacterium]|jgi:GTP:adenosylcobinamide-phosphate guanylyltransferase